MKNRLLSILAFLGFYLVITILAGGWVHLIQTDTLAGYSALNHPWSAVLCLGITMILYALYEAEEESEKNKKASQAAGEGEQEETEEEKQI